MAKTVEQIRNDLSQAMPGQAMGSRSSDVFVQAAKTQANSYRVSCGWAVEEAYNDDYLSFATSNPFAKGTPLQPWIGREVDTESADEAAALYLEWKAKLYSSERHGFVPRGTVIGTVTR
jgi:hypothetical protein